MGLCPLLVFRLCVHVKHLTLSGERYEVASDVAGFQVPARAVISRTEDKCPILEVVLAPHKLYCST